MSFFDEEESLALLFFFFFLGLLPILLLTPWLKSRSPVLKE